MTEARLAEAFIRLRADLKAIDVPWALVGGLAVSARAEPRTTRDIDIAIAVDNESAADKVVWNLVNRGYRPEEVLEATPYPEVERLSTVRLRHWEEEIPIFHDLLFNSSGIEREVVAEADLLEVLTGVLAPVAKVGHLLALKILALRPNRAHERPQDFADIRELLRVANEEELQRARRALELISKRRFDRGKDLEAMFEEQLRQFRQQGRDRSR